jgi:hypothetical protein
MQEFNFYFKWGIDHILTWEALDHILFVTALCLGYLLKNWKKVAILVTAFTIGHSITLLVSGLKWVEVSTSWIEFLVPLTITITAGINFLIKDPSIFSDSWKMAYLPALFFGLIHGLAYANTLLLEGEKGLVYHLFAFNLGIEVAQLLVVALALFISYVVVQKLSLSQLQYIRVISAIIFLISLKMAFERFPLTRKKDKDVHTKTTTASFLWNAGIRSYSSTEYSKQPGVEPRKQI